MPTEIIPTKKKDLIFILFAVLLSLTISKKIWDNHMEKINSITKQVQDFDDRMELAKDVKLLEEQVLIFKEKSWHITDTTPVMGKMNELTTEFSIDTLSINPQGVKRLKKTYSIATLSLNLKSEYFALVRFLSEIENFKKLIKITSLRLRPEKFAVEKEGPHLIIDLVIQAYIF